LRNFPPKAIRELETLKTERDELVSALVALADAELPAALRSMACHGIASTIQQLYTGAERCLGVIATDLDQKPIQRQNDGWHRALLDQMVNPLPDVRPSVLSFGTFEVLEVLRSFRHVVRNTYGSLLDEARVLELAHEAVRLPDLLEADFLILASNLSIDQK
jgi:hypothetical protein